MKRITVLFIAIMACMLTAAAQADTTAIEKKTTETGIEYVDTPDSEQTAKKGKSKHDNPFRFNGDFDANTIIPLVAIVCVFGLPVVIVFLAFYFNYRNRRAKYKLAEQALAAGQPIPTEFFNDQKHGSVLQKGITNTFTGLGLFIFLWAITSEFSIGCIGLLVMFMGLGQIVVHYSTQKNKDKDENRFRNDNNPYTEE